MGCSPGMSFIHRKWSLRRVFNLDKVMVRDSGNRLFKGKWLWTWWL